MCFPAALGLGPIFQALGVAASVGGTLIGAQANANAQAAEAQQAENNSVIAQRNAADARERGIVAQNDQQLKTRARIGMQKNALSERSIAVNSGSALDILGDTAMFGKLDQITTGQNFEREALGFETQSMNFDASAEQSRAASRNSLTAGGISAFSTALGGVGDFYQQSRARKIGFS